MSVSSKPTPDSPMKTKRGKDPVEKFTKKLYFPTAEEKAFFSEYVESPKTVELEYVNSFLQQLHPTSIIFVNLDRIGEGQARIVHVAKLVDIFIRRIIELGGGNLEDTPTWFMLRQSDHHNDNVSHDHLFCYEPYRSYRENAFMNRVRNLVLTMGMCRNDFGLVVEMNVHAAGTGRQGKLEF